MVAELQNPNLFDPFHGSSVLSLFPRTFKDLKETANTEQGEMEIIQNHLKSMVIGGSDKLLEQAKTILNGNQELQKSEILNIMLPDDKDKAIGGKDIGRPQERRPALGCKRAHFSFKPNASQPSLNDNVSLNIDQLQDPEEFFSAFESLENAKKELQKQRGDIPTDSTKPNLSTTARSRRPGILGKTAGYKHRYSSVVADSDEAISSQEIFEKDIPSQSSEIPNIETTENHGPTEETELPSQECMDFIQEKDSIAEAGNRVNSLLDEFLSTNCTELDGDGAVNFLRERLQIKPINLDKLCLPDMENPRKSNLMASVEKLHKRRKVLSDIDNNTKRVISKPSTQIPQVAESSIYQRASPTPPKSPFSSMSWLKTRISQMVPPNNPFSFHGIDISPGRHASPVEGRDREDLSPDADCDLTDANVTLPAELNTKGLSAYGKFQSPMPEEDNTAGSISGKLGMENLACPPGMPTDENPNRSTIHMDIRSNTSDGVLEDKVEDMQRETIGCEQQELGLEELPIGNMDCSGSRLDESKSIAGQHSQDDGHSQTVGALPEQNNEVEDMQQEHVTSEHQEHGLEGLPSGNMDCGGSQLDESNSIANEQRPEAGNSQTADILPEQNNETYQEPSALSSKEKRKRKAPPRNRSKRKEVSFPKSLEEAGTVYGLRRSTRIRTRPLEYWKGERFLYARVEKDVLTVIGLKYESPAKSKTEKPALKVKSYVSDEYKELVEKVAFH